MWRFLLEVDSGVWRRISDNCQEWWKPWLVLMGEKCSFPHTNRLRLEKRNMHNVSRWFLIGIKFLIGNWLSIISSISIQLHKMNSFVTEADNIEVLSSI